MLEKLTNWLKENFLALWNALKDLLGDLGLKFLEMVLDFSATVIESIPAPDVLSQYSMGQLLGQAGPTVAWMIGLFHIPEAMGIFGACYAFRLLRKLLTLGQW